MRKKLLSMILCVIMVICFMPSVAFAEGSAPEIAISEDPQVNVVDTLYTTNDNGLVTPDFTPSEDMKSFGVTLTSTEAVTGNCRITVTDVTEGVQLIAVDSAGKAWDIVKSGWGPAEGFTVGANYNVTTTVYAFATEAKTYSGTVNLVKVSGDSTALATKQISAETLTPALAKAGSSGTVILKGDVTVKDLEIPAGVTLKFSETAKLTVTGKLTVNGTLDLTDSTNDCSGNTTLAESRTLKISSGAKLIVNGTLKSKAQFNDILQLGEMEINSGATVVVGKISETADITYIGTSGMIVLDTGAKIVQKPRTSDTFTGGYTYELSGKATVGSLNSNNLLGTMYVTGKDQFIVTNGAELTINKMAMADGTTGEVPTLENHIIVKSGGKLAVAEGGELSLTHPSAGNTYENWNVDASKRLIKIETGGKFDVSGTVKSNNSFNDICQLGKMTIYSTASYMASSIVTYMGPSTNQNAVAKLESGATVVSEPNTANSFADGYTYTLTGNATAGTASTANFAVLGNDKFVVKNGSILTATNMTLAGAKSDQLVIENGAKLNGTVTFSTGVADIWKVSSGTFTFDPSAYLATGGYYVSNNDDGTYTVKYRSSSSSASSSSSSAGTSTGSVVNTTETKTDGSASGTTTVPETKATVAAETKTAEDGTKTTTAKVDTAVATQIVEMAVENKSEEVIITTAETPVVETAAGTTTEVAIPAEAVSKIAEKTAAAVTIESEAAKVTLDQQAVAAVAEAAGETGTVSLVVETKAQDENKVEVDLKLVTSNVTVSDFKGGSVSVTVKLNSALAGKAVVCVYIDDNGNYHKVAGHKNADGTFTFTTSHFSTYVIMPEEEADAVIASQIEKVKKLLNDTSLKARSSKTKKGNIKVTLKVNKKNIKAIEDLGYTVTYKFSRSTKATSAYKAKAEKAIKTYTDKTGKKGTKYYYKVRVMVYDTDGSLIAKTTLKQCKYASRVK